jgi:hypothetical protein
MPIWSVVRIVACAGAIFSASLLFSTSSKLLIVVKLIALSVSYLLALIISREVGRDDLRLIAKVVRAK